MTWPLRTIALLALIAGCAAPLKRQTIAPFVREPARWPEAYQNNFRRIHTFEGTARLTIESPRVNGHVNIRVIWVAPDTLFVQAEGALGINVGKIFIGKQRFIIYNEYDNQYIAGELSNRYLARFLDTDFSLHDLQSALLGKPPIPLSGLQPADTSRGIFTRQEGEVKYRLVVDPQTGLLEKWEMIRRGRVVARMAFQRYRNQDGIYLPRLIRFTRPEYQERITVFYKTIQINRPIPPKHYTITIKAKAKQLNL